MSQGWKVNNERLEYLGDAVLGAVVADYLYQKYPHKDEGFLTELRSKMVSRNNLNKVAIKMGLPEMIKYDNACQGVFKSKNGDGFEALMGAIYLDRGYKFVRQLLVERIIVRYMDVESLSATPSDFKSLLINWCQRNKKKISYVVDRTFYQGSQSRVQYDVCVIVNDQRFSHAVAFSIKDAEQRASEMTFNSFRSKGVIDNPKLLGGDGKLKMKS